MREINKISESLFEKIRDRFEDVSLGDENAKATSDPEQARFFNFDYVVDGRNYGNITLSVIDEISLKVYFSKNISHELQGDDKHNWYGFLRELREFAKRNLLSFEPRDITRSTLKHRDIQQISKADSTFDKSEVVAEGRMYGTMNRSYEDFGPVRIKVAHAKPIMDETHGARARNIDAVFVENDQGERFRMPFNSLIGTRAMARHISAGGTPSDELGQHICEMVNEMLTLRPFCHSMRHRTFEDTVTKDMLESAFEYHALLKNTLKKMKGKKGYNEYKESYQPALTETDEFNEQELREKFVKKVFPNKLESALPIVHKAYTMMKENSYSAQFESWANRIAEGTWALPDSEEKIDHLAELLGNPLPVGVDAQNATNALYDLIGNDTLFDQLGDLADQDPEADAVPIVSAWLQNNQPELYQQLLTDIGDDPNYPAEPDSEGGEVDEGAYGQAIPGSTQNMLSTTNEEYDEDQVDSIASAIIRRILNNIKDHSELLMKAGPDGVMNAARDVASFHAPVEELGSSDISNMVREVYREVGVEYPKMNEADSAPLRKTASPSKKAKDAKYYDYLARTLGEGKMKEVDMDLTELSDEEFKAKYGKTKDEMKAALAENVGDDVVNRDEKLKRMGAKELGVMDKLKNIPRGLKAAIKGDSEDDLVLYNKSKEALEEMKRLAGL